MKLLIIQCSPASLSAPCSQTPKIWKHSTAYCTKHSVISHVFACYGHYTNRSDVVCWSASLYCVGTLRNSG